jgi:sialate O-acetylesterase
VSEPPILPGIYPNGARGAVSLTYDDALAVHLDTAMPQLESFGLRGTFYIPTRASMADAWRERPADWRAAAERGHEIANHTQYHPCSITHDWVKPNFSLESYSLAAWSRSSPARTTRFGR